MLRVGEAELQAKQLVLFSDSKCGHMFISTFGCSPVTHYQETSKEIIIYVGSQTVWHKALPQQFTTISR